MESGSASGDIVRQLQAQGRARRHEGWVCYHTDLHVFEMDGLTIGVVGCAVGSSFAVLVAEELFACGCQLLISITSAGQIVPLGTPPYFVLIEKALRDEGTSYHYLPPADYSALAPTLRARLQPSLAAADSTFGLRVLQGSTWTTDAPFRETEAAIEFARKENILGVEMEAAGLYAYAEASGHAVLCFAHITNQMAQIEGDFEKGEAQGSHAALKLIEWASNLLDTE